MDILSWFTGKLDITYFWHGWVQFGGQMGIVLGLLSVIVGLTYFKKWRWLWEEWLTTQDAKRIGVMYILVAVIMLVRGFGDAVMMKLQQALASGSSEGFLSADHFQQVFTAHGTIMIFFVAMGLMFGLINLVLPLLIGARDVSFPLMNSVSFYLYLAGVVLANTSLLFGEFGAVGWLAYPPLSGIEFSPGPGVDYWLWSIQIAGVGSTLSAINFLVTIIKERCPGMTWMRLPVFVWSVFVTVILMLAIFPILTATLFMLSLDRTLGMHFFTAGLGGNAMMYINLIWAWGHPEVYVLVMPAFGMYSEIVATFARKKLFGYTSMVWALMLITVLSFLVWGHHFFTMGAGGNVNTFFGIMTMVIAIPTGVKVFNWLFTMYKGRILFASPMWWFMAFVSTFLIGGATGVMLAVPALDFQVHNSLFLVAHFHNTIIGGVVFGYLAGLSYWFPKIFGFKLHERLGKLAVTCWVIGFFVTFMPIYLLGFMGAARRLDHFDPSYGWQWLFIMSGIGTLIIGLGVFFQVSQLAYSIWKHKTLRDTTGDLWNGRTLEWSVPSPAPHYNFARTPTVHARDAWWEQKQNGRGVTFGPYEDFALPKNTGTGVWIGLWVTAFGFAFIWHLWWLALIGIMGVVWTLAARLNEDETQEVITASEAKLLDKKYGRKAAA
ncbi:cbb3-type cytochrome c oxidase subunit I [Candidatus Saccharibacteria bacterium]|nr:cbb3-type cytochrome c oxidase subunit I [Candidatus Saccharibacteria bacterium]